MTNKCKVCGSEDLGLYEEIEYSYKSKPRPIKIYRCNDCNSKLILNNKTEYIDGYYKQFSNEDYQNSGVHNNVNIMTETIKTGTFLDYGCGSGCLLKAMHEKGFDVEGYDVHNGLRFKELEQYATFSDEYKVKENYYDVISLREVFEHLDHPVLVLKDMYNSLKPSGKIYIQTPTADNDDHIGRYAPGHLFLTSEKALKNLLNELGFKNPTTVSLVDGCLVMVATK